jgi:hypothetical protein
MTQDESVHLAAPSPGLTTSCGRWKNGITWVFPKKKRSVSGSQLDLNGISMQFYHEWDNMDNESSDIWV